MFHRRMSCRTGPFWFLWGEYRIICQVTMFYLYGCIWLYHFNHCIISISTMSRSTSGVPYLLEQQKITDSETEPGPYQGHCVHDEQARLGSAGSRHVSRISRRTNRRRDSSAGCRTACCALSKDEQCPAVLGSFMIMY